MFRLPSFIPVAAYVVMLGIVSPALAHGVYHSPNDDGASVGIPASVAPGAPATLHLYLDPGSLPSNGDPCFQGDGDEICGYRIRMVGSGMTLQAFSPADPDALYNLSGTQVDVTGGDFQEGELGPFKLGDLVVQGALGGHLDLTISESVTSQLALERESEPTTIVQLPEPNVLSGFAFGWITLFALRIPRRDRGARSILVVLCVALIPFLAARASAELFGAEQTISTSADAAKSVFAADLDGDGDIDLLSASINDDKVAWYENMDGAGTYGPEQVISTLAANAQSVFAVDVDGDGDTDVLSASAGDDTIAWYENTNGLGAFGPPRVVTTGADGAFSVFAADIDGDGDFDVLSASLFDDKVAWYENTDGAGAFGPQQVITTSADGAGSVHAADLDADGDIDVLSASRLDDTIAWYENTDGLGSFGPQQQISTNAATAVAVVAADINRDGVLDVLSASTSDDKVAWYDGANGWSETVVTDVADGPTSVVAIDVDGDGDLDALSASANDNSISWHENTDGSGSFGPRQVISSTALSARSVFAVDADGDGDADVISASFSDDKIAWYRNERIHGVTVFDRSSVITAGPRGPVSVFAGDLDGDGDVDVLSASATDNQINWYEHLDGLGNFGGAPPVTTNALGAASVFAADLDGDGDLDALSASSFDNKIAWYENTSGNPRFGSERVISLNALLATVVSAADLDGDGDEDVLAAILGGAIYWHENTDGRGSFGPQRTITTVAGGASGLFAADLDGDNDIDVLSASFDDDKIAWYENTDGRGSFGPQQLISAFADGARGVFAADVDGDRDFDVISASFLDDQVSWYENTDGLGTFGTRQVIATAAGRCDLRLRHRCRRRP